MAGQRAGVATPGATRLARWPAGAPQTTDRLTSDSPITLFVRLKHLAARWRPQRAEGFRMGLDGLPWGIGGQPPGGIALVRTIRHVPVLNAATEAGSLICNRREKDRPGLRDPLTESWAPLLEERSLERRRLGADVA